MNYKNEWLGACFGNKKPNKTAWVYVNGEMLGEYSLNIAFEVAKEFKEAQVVSTITGEILN